MAASRGCPFRCNWCAKPIWGNHYPQRSAGEVAAEMTYLKRTFRPDHIWFADDIFGFRVDWVTRIRRSCCERSDGTVPFTIQTRADLISEPWPQRCETAGCAEAWIGAESGSQRVLDCDEQGHQGRRDRRPRANGWARTASASASSSSSAIWASSWPTCWPRAN